MQCPRCSGWMSFDVRDRDYTCLPCGAVQPTLPIMPIEQAQHEARYRNVERMRQDRERV